MNEKTKERIMAWAGILGTFIGIPLLLWIFVVKAPFMVIFSWVAFLIGVPMFWKKFGKGDAVEFWKSILKNGVKMIACLALFLLTRSYFTLIIGFTPFESWVKWSTETGVTAILGYTPTKILFEATFLFVFGYLLVIKSVFDEKPRVPRIILTSFLIICFLLQTFSFGAGTDAARAAKAPLEAKAITNAVESNGAIGGVFIQLKTAAFGKSNKRQIQEKIVPFKPNEPTNSGLVAQTGDTVKYLNPTAPFRVPGKEKFHLISSTSEHESTGFGSIIIYGQDKEGYVQIMVIPKEI